MKWPRFAFLVVLVAVLQASAVMNLVSLTNMRIKPDILLLLLVYFAVSCDSFDAIITSFSLGFAADITGMVLGPHIISYGLVGMLLAHIRKVILLKDTRQQALTILVTGVVTEVIALMLTYLKAPELARTGLFEVFAVAAYSAISWFLLKWLVGAAGKWTGIGVHRFGARAD
ncbi:MAG: rod shape-determining protein MreD [Planctomycetes bacterium RBG_13_44_8b]|nr:MAG: rod shape-determining protein MreD [Planctomycetes bacterium RBG_13_44_8b]